MGYCEVFQHTILLFQYKFGKNFKTYSIMHKIRHNVLKIIKI